MVIEYLYAILATRTVTSSLRSVYEARLTKHRPVLLWLVQVHFIFAVVPHQKRPSRYDARIRACGKHDEKVEEQAAGIVENGEDWRNVPIVLDHEDGKSDDHCELSAADADHTGSIFSRPSDAAIQ